MKSNSSSTSSMKLSSEITRQINRVWQSRQTACPGKSYPSYSQTKGDLILPVKFRQLRALAIFAWFCPDEALKFEILVQLSLRKKGKHLDWKHGDLEKEISLDLMIHSKEICLSLIEEELFFSKSALFGTILKEDLASALREIRIRPFDQRPPRRLVRRKGYRDKGSRRAPDRWTDPYDLSLDLQQLENEKKKLLQQLLYYVLLDKLRK